MFKLLENHITAEIFCDFWEDVCIKKAVEDFVGDLYKVSGVKAQIKHYLPYKESGVLVIGSLDNPRFEKYIESIDIDSSCVKNRWETYLMRTYGEEQSNLVICGSDPRAAMWGIYDLCAKELGVDPLYFWTDNEPDKKDTIIISDRNVIENPKTFKFRGWFVNDEIRLIGWKQNSARRYMNYPHYRQVIHPDVLSKVIETALRLKQNLIIPASFVNIFNPAEEDIVRQVTERGMFISQHHVEPMGVSHFAWDNYWESKGEKTDVSFVRYPDKFVEIWTEYAGKWAKYKNIVWQLGLRGRGDNPVWSVDKSVPASMEDRGKLISSAIKTQKEIVERVLGHSDFFSTATLYYEGTELYRSGYLAIPQDTMIVLCGDGPSQMVQIDPVDDEKRKTNPFGVYYHVAFWDCGPHLAQGVSLDKIYYNYKKLSDSRVTELSIINVSNIREFVLGINAVSQITWDIASFNRDSYLSGWCTAEFSPARLEPIVNIYNRFYDSYFKLKSDMVSDQELLLDGVARSLGLSLVNMDYDFDKQKGIKARYYSFKDYGEFISFYKQTVSEGLLRWKEVYKEGCEAIQFVAEHRKDFYTDNLLIQMEIVIGLYEWLYNLLQARDLRMSENDRDTFRHFVNKAAESLEKVLTDRQKAAHGKWDGWHRQDGKFNVELMLEQTRALL